MPPLAGQKTIGYKTYVKQVLTEALGSIFGSHPDILLRNVNVTIDFPTTRSEYPAIIVRFYERDLYNAGVGHEEWFEQLDQNGDGTGLFRRYKHFLYEGDIEFAIYALSSHDRDLLSDSLIQTLTMGDIEAYTIPFLNRVYKANPTLDPISLNHFINLNTDRVQGFGETQAIAPWQPEDTLVYQTSYRIGIHGEFYNRDLTTTAYGKVERVETYPYDSWVGEPEPNPNPSDPGEWTPPSSANPPGLQS